MQNAVPNSASVFMGNFTLPIAARLARSGQFNAAVDMLDNCANQDASVRLLRGRVRAQSGDVDNARSEFQSLLTEDPHNGEAVAALAALDADRGQRLTQRNWMGVLFLVTLLITLAILMKVDWSGPTERYDDAAMVAAISDLGDRVASFETRLESAGVRPENTTTAGLVPDEFLAFADVHHFINTDPGYANVECVPTFPDQANLTIQCSGTVLSDWMAEQMHAAVRPRARGLSMDFANVAVSGRYRVQKNDTLGHIANLAYGDVSRWQDIWQSNQSQLSTPDILIPGVELIIP